MAGLQGAAQLRFCREFMCRKGQEIRNKADRRKYQLEWHPDRPHCKVSAETAAKCEENFKNMNACIDQAKYYCSPGQSDADFEQMLHASAEKQPYEAYQPPPPPAEKKFSKKEHEKWTKMVDQVEAAVKAAMVNAELYLAAQTLYADIQMEIFGGPYEPVPWDKAYLINRLSDLSSLLDKQPVIVYIQKQMRDETIALVKLAFSVLPAEFLEKVQKRIDLMQQKVQHVLDQQKGEYNTYSRGVLEGRLTPLHAPVLDRMRRLVKTREWILSGMKRIEDPYHELMVLQEHPRDAAVKEYNKVVLEESNLKKNWLDKYFDLTKEDVNRMRRNYKIPVARQPRKVKEKEKEEKKEKKERKKKAKTEKKSPPSTPKVEKQQQEEEEEEEYEPINFKRKKPRRRRELGEDE